MSAPPPVPALPDTQRLVSYFIAAQTGPFSVNFALYGDGADYGDWIEVWLNEVELIATQDYTLSSPTGTIGSIPLPITDAVINLTIAQTGTLTIIGARRPRRVTQFSENTGVAARDLNQALTDMVAEGREAWDFRRSRQIYFPGGETVTTQLPSVAQRASRFLFFDSSGNPTCVTGIPAAPPVGRNLQPAFNDRTVYVSPTGNNSTGDGTAGNPWQTPFHAFLQLINNYDGSSNAEAYIQLANGTYNIPSADGTVAYHGGPSVGWTRINILGNPASPGSVILDGTLCGSSADCVYLSQTAGGGNMGVNGVTIQNWGGAGFNCQGVGSSFYPQNIIFGNNVGNHGVGCFQIEMGFVEVEGPITFNGTTGVPQGVYCQQAVWDWNNQPITFGAGAAFSYAFVNTENRAMFSLNPSTVTGTCTGTQYYVNNGAVLDVKIGDAGYTAPGTTAPGTPNSGRVNSGFVNGVFYGIGPGTAPGSVPTVAQLYTGATQTGGRTMVSDSTVAASGNFGAIVAGGGANIVPVWHDGTNWRIG